LASTAKDPEKRRRFVQLWAEVIQRAFDSEGITGSGAFDITFARPEVSPGAGIFRMQPSDDGKCFCFVLVLCIY
jgi:hypothetical protein